MKRFLLCGLVLFASVPSWAGNDSPMPKSPGAPGPKWSLKVLQPHVAMGGFPGEEHHTEFVLRAVDAKGVPLKGVTIELPAIWGKKGVLGDKDPQYPEAKMPRVEWHSHEKTTVTDVKGEAHGLFTSGGVEIPVTLHGPGDTQAKIEQAWNENEDAFDENTEGEDGNTTRVRYTMRLSRDGKLIPITGHHLEFALSYATLSAYRPTAKLDENGQPETEEDSFELKIKKPKDDASAEEKARWEIICSWFQLGEIREVEPGIYQGIRSVTDLDQKGIILDGMRIDYISDYDVRVEDQDCFEDEDAPHDEDDD